MKRNSNKKSSYLPSYLPQVWQETQSRLEDLQHADKPVVLKAAPGSGKTYSIFRVAKQNRRQLTYLTARTDLYAEAKEHAEDAGFCSQDIAVLPSPHSDCPTFNGTHGRDEKEKLRRLYRLGINAEVLHQRLELPCQPDCPYLDKRITNPDDYDVIIGYYTHGQNTEKIDGRLTVIDEFPGSAFATSFSNASDDTMTISEALNGYFAAADYLPWDNYGDFIANIDDEPVWKISGDIQYHGFEAARDDIINLSPDKRYHRLAPLIVFALHNAANVDDEWITWDALDELGNDWYYFNASEFFDAYPSAEQIRWRTPGRTIISRKEGDSLAQEEIHVLRPVDLSPAEQIIGLDGTAREKLWNTIFTQDFEIEEYIANDRMADYVTEVQEIDLAITGNGTKPYSSGNNVSPETDAAVTLWTRIMHGEPILITPKKAGFRLKEEVSTMLEEDINPVQSGDFDFMTYGMVSSNNDAAGADALHICGSPHPGDKTLKKWGAFMGECVERQGNTKGMNLTYEPRGIGQAIQHHFIQDRVTQAILRGRKSSPNDNGAFVIVNTRAVPDWFPPATELSIDNFPFRSQDRRSIVRHLLENGETTTSELAEKDDIHPQTARDCLQALIEIGWVTSTDRPGPNATVYEWDL